MIRPFGLRDVLAVRKLQRDGAWLDLNHYLLQRRSALATALISPVPWLGTGLASYVWRTDRGVEGFVQMLKRSGRLEADLLFVAPGIEQRHNGRTAWEKMLAFCTANAGEHGVRRLFASLPEGSAEIEVLVGLGFMIYTNENILVLPRAPKDAPAPASGQLRPRQAKDVWWLRRLYSLFTPLPVQHAEGMNDSDQPTAIPPQWWELTHQTSYVLVEEGEVCGGAQLISGRRGHWLLLHGDPSSRQHMDLLVQQGIHAAAGNKWPVYCAVRDYQGGLRPVLEDRGFEPFTRRSRLVKHMTVQVKVPERAQAHSFAIEQSP